MSDEVVRWLIGGARFVHGVGHSLGFWMPSRCWLAPGSNDPLLRRLSNLLWAAAIVGFVAASLSYLGILLPVAWWSTLALVSAAVSLLGLVLFFGNWPVFNTIAALAMDVVVLLASIAAKV
jgi:hypothetical protein